MTNQHHFDDIAKDRYTALRKASIIKPFQNKPNQDKLIIGGTNRETYHQEDAPFCIWKKDYNENLDSLSWKSICKRRTRYDILMEGGNNNESRKNRNNKLNQ